MLARLGDHRLRYLGVGAFCALLHNAIVITGSFVHLHYLATTLVSYVVVCLAGYALHSRLTYRRPMSRRGLALYSAAMFANYPFSVALMFLLCDLAGLSVPLASPVATLVLMLWNYGSSRWVIRRNAVPLRPSARIDG